MKRTVCAVINGPVVSIELATVPRTGKRSYLLRCCQPMTNNVSLLPGGWIHDPCKNDTKP
jgi:hypothetical protein